MSAQQDPGGLKPHPTLTDYYADEPGRRRFVSWLFDETAPNYDRIIGLMSFGSGTWYRGDALKRSGLAPGMRLLDVACGSGPVTQEGRRRVGSEGCVVALDPSLGMLRETKKRVAVPLIQAGAESLPLKSGSFDFLSMGYALRHVADIDRTFREYHRVLAPHGRVLVLEMTRPRSRFQYAFTRLYMGRIVPAVARLTTNSRDSATLMHYFWDTIENCVPPETIENALRAAGFRDVRRKVFFGVFSEYTGTKP